VAIFLCTHTDIDNCIWLDLTTNFEIMRKAPSYLFVFFFFFLGCKATKSTSAIEYGEKRYPKADTLDSLFKKKIAQKDMAGVVCLVSEKGKIVYSNALGYRNIEKGLPMEEKSIFRLQSMNKPIVSLAVLKLCMEGKISLEDSASKYFPELKEKKVGILKEGKIQYIDANTPITLKHLLSHSSGLGSSWNAGPLKSIYESYATTDFNGFDEKLKAYMQLPLIDQPGHSWYYGRGHDIMANLIEKVTGKSFKEYLNEEIFKPLKMDMTTYYLPKGEEKNLAQFYSLADDGRLKKTLEDSSYTGGYDLMSTAEDYYKFCTLLLNNGYVNGKEFISPSLLREMSTPAIGNNAEAIPWQKGYAFGLGVSVRVDSVKADFKGSIGDYGWFGFFNTAFWIDPQKQIIGIVLTQSPWNGYNLSKEVKNIVYSEK
jgi:CubicO group peptidase (beta-lactamase class C family)